MKIYKTNSKELKVIDLRIFDRSLDLSVLLRKEVIHPHVPVGIPCYDFTPIICPTLDGSLLFYRLGHRLRVLQTLMV